MDQPLPPGWTSHTAPTGHVYYYNPSTNTSTYTHPSLPRQPPKQKKEKPKRRDPIPGAEGWLRVTTNKGNIFYFHSETKRSEWTVPSEIADAVNSLDRHEADFKKQEMAKQAEDRKRKAEEGEPITTFEAESEPKKARVEEEEEEEEDDEAWQRAMAAEMAQEAEAQPEPRAPTPPPQAAASPSPEPVPDPEDPESAPSAAAPTVELSLEEQKSLFSTMLTSLNGTPNEINPMAPWDRELPKFINQPAYSSVQHSRDRQDAFNEWCKLRLREKRAQKNAAPTASSSSTPIDPATAYAALLEKEVTSTRTKWDDFRRAHKKERAFFQFGRDDRERERGFKDHLKRLGEKKRKAALEAEEDFLELLSATLPGSFKADVGKLKEEKGEKEAVALVWREAKRTPGLDTDPRYEAVGSSTRRQELFGEWSRGERRRATSSASAPVAAKQESKEEATARALGERQGKVRREKARIEAKNRAAFSAATAEDSTITFEAMLVDAVKTPGATLESVQDDPRFNAPGLSAADKQRLLDAHLQRLEDKRRKALHAVFESHTPSLDADAEFVLPLVCNDDRMHTPSLARLLHHPAILTREFKSWKAKRESSARDAFFNMLNESAFVEFWGRMKKSVNTDNDEAKKQGDEDEDEEQEQSLLDMAKKVDLAEITSVIRNDARYKAFEHLPHKREEWIRQHLQSLAAPKKSIYQQ